MAKGVRLHGDALIFAKDAGHLSVPGPDEPDQVLLLRQGFGFALEVVRLVRALPDPVAVRCIVGVNTTNGTFRFHRAGAAPRTPPS